MADQTDRLLGLPLKEKEKKNRKQKGLMNRGDIIKPFPYFWNSF